MTTEAVAAEMPEDELFTDELLSESMSDYCYLCKLLE